MLSANPVERRVQVSALILLVGLVVEVLCLLGKGPIAFLLFAGVCATLFLLGILVYLHLLASSSIHHDGGRQM